MSTVLLEQYIRAVLLEKSKKSKKSKKSNRARRAADRAAANKKRQSSLASSKSQYGKKSTVSGGLKSTSTPFSSKKIEMGSEKKDVVTDVEKKVTQKLVDKLGLSAKDASALMSDTGESKNAAVELAARKAEELEIQRIYDKVTQKAYVVDVNDFKIRMEEEFMAAMQKAISDDSAPNVIAANVNDVNGKPLPIEDGWRAFLVGGKPTYICVPKDKWNEFFGM